jgi:hypothetical protein
MPLLQQSRTPTAAPIAHRRGLLIWPSLPRTSAHTLGWNR